jgi:hypothetical protein
MGENVFMTLGRKKIKRDIIGQLFKSSFKLSQVSFTSHIALGRTFIGRVLLHNQNLLVFYVK